MKRPRPSPAPGPASAPEPPQARFRSGAVARMAQMPVATLRVWEQRYGAVRPASAPSGHRMYSSADVQRVLLLRQLATQGHAIGSIAGLDSAQLLQLQRSAAGESTRLPGQDAAQRPAPWRLIVVGQALAARLQRAGVARALQRPVRLVAVFDTLAEAAAGVPGDRAGARPAADMLLWHAPELQPGAQPQLQAARTACRARRVTVLYRFAAAAAVRALTAIGVHGLREPVDDEALGAALRVLAPGPGRGGGRSTHAPAAAAVANPPGIAPRRFDDAALTRIAGLPSTLACECPRHVAELLMQLASFEAYSAGCSRRDARDAELHAYLQQVAGASRVLFETALERVARHEGLTLG